LNIHGLWPSVNEGEQPANCPGPAFNPANISSETALNMISDWSGLYSSPTQFHGHEWTKHGTCWNDPDASGNKINDFFTQVITIAQSMDIYNILAKAGITPSNSQTYNTSSIVSAISNALKVQDFEVICAFSSE